MTAIINVNKKSAYAKFNGLTFNVKSIYNTTIDLDINGVTVAFGFSEIIIVNIQAEMQKFFDLYNWDGNTTYIKLQSYCAIKNYQVDVTYNCHA